MTSPFKTRTAKLPVMFSPVKNRLRRKLAEKRKRAKDASSDSEEVEARRPPKGNNQNNAGGTKEIEIVILVSDDSCGKHKTDDVIFTSSSDTDGSSGNVTRVKTRVTSFNRSNLNSAMKELSVLTLKEEHVKLMRLTPFHTLFESLSTQVDEQKLRMCKKRDSLIKTIVNSFSVGHDAFMLGDKPVKLTDVDFTLILGVCEGGQSVEEKLRKGVLTEWMLRCFGSEITKAKKAGRSFCMERALIYRKLVEKIESEERIDIEDVVRLINCHILVSVLITNQNGSMRNDVAQLFEKLEYSCLYDWGGYFADFLVAQIKTKTKMVGGCAVILPFFVFEHSNLMEAVYPEVFPRYLKWDMADGNKELEKTRIRKLKGVKTKIVATAAERATMASIVAYHEKVAGKAKVHVERGVKIKSQPIRPIEKKYVPESLICAPFVSQSAHDVIPRACVKLEFGVQAKVQVTRGTAQNANYLQADITESHNGSDDDLLVRSTYDGQRTPIYNNPVVNEEALDATAPEQRDGCPELLNKTRMVDLNEPLFLTPAHVRMDVIEAKNAVNEGQGGLFVETLPSFDIGFEPTPAAVTVSQVQRYVVQNSLVDHLENVTNDVSELTNEVLMLKELVEVLKKDVVDREARINELEYANITNRQMYDEKMMKLQNENERLVLEAKSLGDATAYLSQQRLEENALKAEIRVDDLNKVINKKEECIESLERALAAKEENIILLSGQVLQLQEQAKLDQSSIDAVNVELQKYTNPTDSQIMENPIIHQLSDTLVELHNVSNAKQELERGKAEDEAMLSEQKKLISRLASVTLGLQGTVTPKTMSNPDSTMGEDVKPIQMVPFPELICIDDEDDVSLPTKAAVSPSSLAKRVKIRTCNNARTTKNMSPLASYGNGVTGLRGGSSRNEKNLPLSDEEKPSLIFYERFNATSKTPGATRNELRKAWEANGENALIWKGSVPQSDVKLKEVMAVLRHENIPITIINAYPDLVSKELKRMGRKVKTHTFTARFLAVLRQKPNANRRKFLEIVVASAMSAIMDAEVLLFPLNPVFGEPESSAQPEEWILLKFVRVSGEWHVFNSMQEEDGRELDDCKDDVQLVIGFMEACMRKQLSMKGGKHSLLKRGDVGKPIVKRSPQRGVGRKDTAAIVVNVMERSLKRDYNMPLFFTDDMSGRFRCKLVECFTHKGEFVPIFS